MKMAEKTKKYLAIGAGGIVCIGLLAAIGTAWKTACKRRYAARTKFFCFKHCG